MCCFTDTVTGVSNTAIFARSSDEGRQLLVYSMFLSSQNEMAMVLPLPVPRNSPEDSVKFIDLKEYPSFFPDLNLGFPVPKPAGPVPAAAAAKPAVAPAPLEVVDVGEFIASFVPSMADFSRLDERFRLKPSAFEQIPRIQTWGFAVFQLKPGFRTVHPMAFSFPRANPERLFFPTVHIHDGEVHEKATFDHRLYCQPAKGEDLMLSTWEESPNVASTFMKIGKTKGIVDGDAHCYRLKIVGEHPNLDTYA